MTNFFSLNGGESARFLDRMGFDFVGIDHDKRAYFFGKEAPVDWSTRRLVASLPRFRHEFVGIRDAAATESIFNRSGMDGHERKRVRGSIHSTDLVQSSWDVFGDPRPGAAHNMGGLRHSDRSVPGAIRPIAEPGGREIDYALIDSARAGNQIWWISDAARFQRNYPGCA